MEYTIKLTCSEDGFWLANMQSVFGEVSDSPGEAVTTLLENAGIETVTGAMVMEDAHPHTLAVLQALLRGFEDGTFAVTKKRWSDSDPYNATLQAARAAIAKAIGETTND